MASWVLPSDAEDREILDATRRADPSAFDLLYRNYSAAVRGLCRKLLSDNTAAADDACQETMLKAYQALPRFRPGARIWPWLSTIARNVCTDMHRDRQRVIVCADPQVREVSPGPEEIAASRSRVRILRTSLRRVERRQRMYVYLRDAFGWSYEQIADFDHTTVPAVRSVLHRGRSTLRDTVVTVARERHEWPLPAFVPALWLRARVRVSQAKGWARDQAASWAARLDPASVVNSVVGSHLAINTSIAAVLLAGAASAALPSSAPDVTITRAAPIAATAGASVGSAAVGGAESEQPGGAPAAPAPTVAGAQPNVDVTASAGITHRRDQDRDVYEFMQAQNSVDTGEPRSDPDPVEGTIAAGWTCATPDDRQAVSAAVCPMLDEVGK